MMMSSEKFLRQELSNEVKTFPQQVLLGRPIDSSFPPRKAANDNNQPARADAMRQTLNPWNHLSEIHGNLSALQIEFHLTIDGQQIVSKTLHGVVDRR